MTTKSKIYECPKCGTRTTIVSNPIYPNPVTLTRVYCPCCTTIMMAISDEEKFPSYTKTEKFFKIDARDASAVQARVIHAQQMYRKGIRSIKTFSNVDLGGNEIYMVNSEDRMKKYIVTENENRFSCNCPDHVYRNKPCKHIILVIAEHY